MERVLEISTNNKDTNKNLCESINSIFLIIFNTSPLDISRPRFERISKNPSTPKININIFITMAPKKLVAKII